MFCGCAFIAKTTVTKYCSLVCAQKAYKRNIRTALIAKAGKESIQESKAHYPDALKRREFLSIKDVCEILGTSRWTIYKLIHNGQLFAKRIGRRKIINRKHIDQLMNIV
jgi:excisionase family DNA binding protein